MSHLTCQYCHLRYDNNISYDVRKHNKRHKKYQTVEERLGFLPMSYEERVDLQSEAYNKLKEENTDEEQFLAALKLIRTYFDRSFESAIQDGYWEKHPRFESYIASFPSHTNVPEAILNKIRTKYGRLVGEVPDGQTDWYPPRSKARKRQFEEAEKRKQKAGRAI